MYLVVLHSAPSPPRLLRRVGPHAVSSSLCPQWKDPLSVFVVPSLHSEYDRTGTSDMCESVAVKGWRNPWRQLFKPLRFPIVLAPTIQFLYYTALLRYHI